MLDKLIKYFVYETKGYITKTQLVKFLYLADLYAVKWTGQQLTELDWYYYTFGPWHEDVYAALNQMDGQEIVQEPQGNSILLKLGSKAGTLEDLDLPIGLKLMLDNIRREWAGLEKYRLQQLLEYVYNTAPMLEVTKNHTSDEKVRLNLLAENEKLINELG